MHDIYEQLILHEGLRLKPYRCPAGKLTIGIGINIEAGISRKEAMWLCKNRVQEIAGQLEKYDWYKSLDDIRKKVIIDMAYNLGVAGLLQFKNMIQCLKDGEYIAAANEMMNSLWYTQVGVRARRLVKMMKTGEDYK